jgi:phosphonate degradation associated HDIG domain protein
LSISQELCAIYDQRGASAYFGEDVTIAEHSLQAAYFAQAADAPEALVIAALLHDVGHLLGGAPDDLAEWTEDAHHELIGGGWLAKRFGPEVAEPVRLHVPAKRYLCATDSSYFDKLSAASVVTLKLQGGPMTAPEIAAFETRPYWREAIRVRQWDDEGKVAGLRTPDFKSYVTLIERLAAPRNPR